MILVCRPRIDPATLDVPQGVERHGRVPDLCRHLSVYDLAVVQGGGTATHELTALRRPFLFFPIESHSEQEVTIARRLARHRAGMQMTQGLTTPSSLADAIVANVGREATYAQTHADGAHRTAKIILERTSAVAHRNGSLERCERPQLKLSITLFPCVILHSDNNPPLTLGRCNALQAVALPIP